MDILLEIVQTLRKREMKEEILEDLSEVDLTVEIDKMDKETMVSVEMITMVRIRPEIILMTIKMVSVLGEILQMIKIYGMIRIKTMRLLLVVGMIIQLKMQQINPNALITLGWIKKKIKMTNKTKI
jgi:hypothetical protein